MAAGAASGAQGLDPSSAYLWLRATPPMAEESPVVLEAARLLAAGFLPIPSRNKRPAVPHKPVKGGAPRWSRDMVLANLSLFRNTKELGVLCDAGLFIIDYDELAVYEQYRADGFAEAFDSTAMARTRKGFHVWFKRTPLCDELEMTDGPVGSSMKDGVLRKNPIDIKSLTASASVVKMPDGSTKTYYTPGMVAVYPSANKTWVRSPVDHPLMPVPDDLVRRLHAERNAARPDKPAPRAKGAPRASKAAKTAAGASPGAASAAKAAPPASPAVVPGPRLPFWRPCALDLINLEPMGFTRSKVYEVVVYPTMNARMEAAGYCGGIVQFKMPKGTPCPLCRKPEGHDNAYWLGKKPGGVLRVRSMSDACFPGRLVNGRWQKGALRVGVDVEWTEEGKKAWREAMRAFSTPASERAVAMLAAAYPYFAEPRDAFFFEHRRLVLTCERGVAVICYGPRETAAAGVALAALTDAPWDEPLAGAWPIPFPASFFAGLEIMK